MKLRTLFLAPALALSLAACTRSPCASGFAEDPASTCVLDGKAPRNLFAEYLGKSEAEIRAKTDAAWQQIFYGNDETERLYYPVGDDMAYIYSVDSNDVRSEGMSYGMMIAVQLDKKEEFDHLWKWACTYMRHDSGSRAGYFSWSCRPDGTIVDPGSASDGEEWFATALFMASGRWGDGTGIFDYRKEANAILHTMLHTGEEGQGDERTINMFSPTTKQIRFVPLAQWAEVSDPSYHLPFFYELWARWADEDNEFWKEAANVSRELFRKAAHPQTGLMPDYCHMDGTPYDYQGHGDFRFDAHRTLAFVAMDWDWTRKDPWQVEQSNRVLRFLSPYRGRIPFAFSLDGRPLTEGASTSIRAMAAVAALAADRDVGEPFVQDLWDEPIPDGKYRYYNGMLYMLGLLQTSGQMRMYAPESVASVQP